MPGSGSTKSHDGIRNRCKREEHSARANGVVELSPFEFLDRLSDLVPPPRKHRHRLLR